MKSLAIFLILSVLISFSFATQSNFQIQELTESPCDSQCLSCQQVVYNLKFQNKANCQNSHCKSTVFKIFNF